MWLVVVLRRSGGGGRGEERNYTEIVEDIGADMLDDR